MDHIGIDVREKEGQICILAEDGELLERPVRTSPRGLAGRLQDPAATPPWVGRTSSE